MTTKLLNQFKYSVEKNVVTYYMNVTIGSSGAPTLAVTSAGATENKGIQAIVRNSTGNYTVTLGDPNNTQTTTNYSRILQANFQVLGSALSASPSLQFMLFADSVSTGTFQFQAFENSSGTPTAVDIDSGFTLLVEIVMKSGLV